MCAPVERDQNSGTHRQRRGQGDRDGKEEKVSSLASSTLKGRPVDAPVLPRRPIARTAKQPVSIRPSLTARDPLPVRLPPLAS
jgi:hypothetical protein